MTFAMPIEVFVTLIVSSVVLGITGLIRTPQIPALVAFGGIIFLFIGVTTDTIQMGNLVSSSTNSGSTTNYVYTPDNFTLGQVKFIFAVIGVTFMLSGALMQMREMQ